MGALQKDTRAESRPLAEGSSKHVEAGDQADARLQIGANPAAALKRLQKLGVSSPVHGAAHVEEVPEGAPRVGRSPSVLFEITEKRGVRAAHADVQSVKAKGARPQPSTQLPPFSQRGFAGKGEQRGASLFRKRQPSSKKRGLRAGVRSGALMIVPQTAGSRLSPALTIGSHIRRNARRARPAVAKRRQSD